MMPQDPVTRRGVLRTGIAVFGGATLVGRAAETSSATASSRLEATSSAKAHGEKPYTGYVFRPDYGTYHEFTPFQIVFEYRESRASIGIGPKVCEKPRRAYVPYEIQYHDSEQTTAILAVPVENRQDLLPHEYFVPRARFHFVETDGQYVFHGDCDSSPTLVQHGVFTRVV